MVHNLDNDDNLNAYKTIQLISIDKLKTLQRTIPIII